MVSIDLCKVQISKILIGSLQCRGGLGPKACLLAIKTSDFVLPHNKASEGLVKTDCVGYDLYSGISDTKALFLKFCKQVQRRIRSLVPLHHIVPAGDGEDSTTISVPGLVVDAKATKKKTFAPQKVEHQFLENHKTLLRRCIWTSITITRAAGARGFKP